jgi:hypothetical protein
MMALKATVEPMFSKERMMVNVQVTTVALTGTWSLG